MGTAVTNGNATHHHSNRLSLGPWNVKDDDVSVQDSASPPVPPSVTMVTEPQNPLPLSLLRPTYFLERPELGRLNDIDFNQACVSALAEVFRSLGSGGDLTLLDITRGVSILPLQALKLGASEVCLVGQNLHTQQLLTDIALTNSIDTSGLFFEGHDFEFFESNWSVLVTELVEPCGCLRQQV